MHLLRRPLTALFTAAALAALLAVPAFAADHEYPASSASVAKPATVGVQTCKSSAYYSGRQLSFRAKISRQALDVPQKLAVRVTVYRRLAEQRAFKVLSREKAWSTASDPDAGVYQHDVILAAESIETKAQYRAKVSFRWSNAATGVTEAKKTVWSKVCKQRKALPRLTIFRAGSVQVPGKAEVTHTFTVSNNGGSEATDVDVQLRNDNAGTVPVATYRIDSIGPKQTVTVSLTAPNCTAKAVATLMPTFPLSKRNIVASGPLVIDTCN